MPILPSLLEYSSEQLVQKLMLIKEQKIKFQELTSNLESVNLHLDFVLKQFAIDRGVMQSLGLETVFEQLAQFFEQEKLQLSIHLMGEIEDLVQAYKFFENLKFNSNWQYLVFVPQKFWQNWQQNLKSPNLKIGVWYDLGNWQNKSFEARQNYLLMTVLAGKSGQKLTEEIKNQVLQIATQNPQSQFILDGGWQIDNLQTPNNVDLVSYSSFWREFENKNRSKN